MRSHRMFTPRAIVFALAACLATIAAPLRAETLLTSGHVDIGANFEGGAWEFEVHDEDSNTAFDPADVVLVVPLAARGPRPASSNFDFLGVPVGSDVWILPQTRDPSLLFLGIASEETDPADFAAWSPGDPRLPSGNFKWLRWDLVAASTPLGGQFSVFNVRSFGDPLLWMSTYANPNDNSFFQRLGGHSHTNFAFTAAGDYLLTFRVTAMLADGSMTQSDEGTFRFRVLGSTQVVPEPSSIALALSGLGLLAGIRLRRRHARD